MKISKFLYSSLAMFVLGLTYFTFSVASTSAASGTTPLYRFYNKQTGVHFYTNSQSERENVQNTLSGKYQLEGVAGHTFNTQEPSSSPVFRFYNMNTGVHFYTNSQSERENVQNTLSSVYRFEGVAYYSYPYQQENSTPVYRFYSSSKGAHFYTNSQAEYISVLNNLSHMYKYEGYAYYLPAENLDIPDSPTPVNPTIGFSEDGCTISFTGAPGIRAVDKITGSYDDGGGGTIPYERFYNFVIPEDGTLTQSIYPNTPDGSIHYAEIYDQNGTLISSSEAVITNPTCPVTIENISQADANISYSPDGCYRSLTWPVNTNIEHGLMSPDGMGKGGGDFKSQAGTSYESYGYTDAQGHTAYTLMVDSTNTVIASKSALITVQNCPIDLEPNGYISEDGCFIGAWGPIGSIVTIGTYLSERSDSTDSADYTIQDDGFVRYSTQIGEPGGNWTLLPPGFTHFFEIKDSEGNMLHTQESEILVPNCYRPE